MANREWVGNYQLTYLKYLSYKNVWIARTCSLGKCLGKEEAFEKAVNFINTNEQDRVDYNSMYVSDGWGNRFYAKEN